MGKRVMVNLLQVLVLVMCFGVMAMAMSFDVQDEDWGRDQREEESERPRGHRNWFLLQQSRLLLRTEAGQMRVVRSVGQRMVDRNINVGFLSMEPNSLFIPQYLDSSMVLFVHTGQANVGLVRKNELGERQLQAGDLYRIPAGSTFYLQNVGEQGQRLELILSIDTSQGLSMGTLENFFIGGGTYPKSVLAGFDSNILRSAFNVSSSELKQVLTRQQEGPIVSLNNTQSSSNIWAKLLSMKEQDRLQELKKLVNFPEEQEQTQSSSWRKLLNSIFGTIEKEKRKQNHHQHSQEAYNLYNRKPDFQNNYGSSFLVDENDYSPLKDSGIGAYLVNLKAGSMLAPHVNPTATEYGVVLRGSGSLQIVFPNGTLAMKATLKPGRVFWVPKYFPFVQVASNNEQLQIFGFTVSSESSQPNHPQFLAGSTSVLESLRGPELAAAFGVSERRLNNFVNAQREAVFLPYNAEIRERNPKAEW